MSRFSYLEWLLLLVCLSLWKLPWFLAWCFLSGSLNYHFGGATGPSIQYSMCFRGAISISLVPTTLSLLESTNLFLPQGIWPLTLSMPPEITPGCHFPGGGSITCCCGEATYVYTNFVADLQWLEGQIFAGSMVSWLLYNCASQPSWCVSLQSTRQTFCLGKPPFHCVWLCFEILEGLVLHFHHCVHVWHACMKSWVKVLIWLFACHLYANNTAYLSCCRRWPLAKYPVLPVTNQMPATRFPLQDLHCSLTQHSWGAPSNLHHLSFSPNCSLCFPATALANPALLALTPLPFFYLSPSFYVFLGSKYSCSTPLRPLNGHLRTARF